MMLLIGGCATSGYETQQNPADVEDRVVIDGKVLPLPEENRIHSESMSGSSQMSPVASKLFVSSQTQQQAGDFAAAENSLERALRIEPRNALLWNRLAEVKYAQNKWQQSVQLASKSNTLSAGNVNLRRRNWYLIANAYNALGDEVSAQKYREKLNR